MRSISVPALSTAAAPTRVVWLPGAYHAARDFLTAGFAEAVRIRRIALDLTFVDMEIGGLFALDYAASHPDELDGLCLLAPYLGNRMLTAEIAHAPGLERWQPGELAETDEERRIWRYIKSRHADSRPLYLGFGRGDRFAAAHELLAATLPADSVNVIGGGHEWSTWIRLWENFLESRFT